MKTSLLVALLSIALALTLTVPFAGAASYTLTSFDYTGGDETILSGINNNGQIVGQIYYDAGADPYFIYSNGIFNLIPPVSSSSVTVTGINDSGQMSGYYRNAATNQWAGFIYHNSVFTDTNIAYEGRVTYACDINSRGEVFGKVPGTREEYFIYKSPGTYVPINSPQINETLNIGSFNDNGLVVGFSYTSHRAVIFNLNNSEISFFSFPFQDTADLELIGTSAADINNGGTIVGNYTVMGYDYTKSEYLVYYYGFIKEGDSFTTIAFPGSTETWISGINDLGQIVGYYVDSNDDMHGFVGNPVPSAGSFNPAIPLLLLDAYVQ